MPQGRDRHIGRTFYNESPPYMTISPMRYRVSDGASDVRRERFQRQPPPGKVIIDAPEHQRRAQAWRLAGDFLAREPVRRDDRRIEDPRRLVIAHTADEGNSQRAVPARAAPLVDPQQRLGA